MNSISLWNDFVIQWKIKKKKWETFFRYEPDKTENLLFELYTIALYFKVDFIELFCNNTEYTIKIENMKWKIKLYLIDRITNEERLLDNYLLRVIFWEADYFDKKKRKNDVNLVVRLEKSNHKILTEFKINHWNTSINEILNTLIEKFL